ncbi:F-box domain-containing protein [Mycena sanguinolenta]|uniref:F-box domain-containing protein n=1 Tax=Mycena sanguinolenta TaxID=230812 RepID=A0A8H6ZG29_9AGAR|nr:F-box domain-containing protein [Mycena sanguinolenta]
MEADRVRLLDLETRILDLERSPLRTTLRSLKGISYLRAEQALLQKRLDAYKYPVLTLPNELTSEFFIHLLPIYPAAPPLTGLASPITLTHVCRQWREVALATPALWRAIRLHYRYQHEMYIPSPFKQMNISDAWIRRSGSCPLSIDINIPHSDVMRQIFTETLTMSATRWEHLTLHGVALLPFLKTGHPMPLLRSLELKLQFSHDVFTFPDAPQLCTVFLTGLVACSKVNLPWTQLTCLTLRYVGIHQCVSILRQTTNLVRCTLHLHSPSDFPESELTLSFLKFLALEATTPLPADGLLSFFVVPSLQRLELQEIFLGAEPIPALEPFIAKPEYRLEEVCIIGSTATRAEQYRLAFPSIRVFYRLD